MLRPAARLIPVIAVTAAICVPLTGASAASCARKHESDGCRLPTGTLYSNSQTANGATAFLSVTPPGRRRVRGLGPVQTYWQVSGSAICNARLGRNVVFGTGLDQRLKVGRTGTGDQTGTAEFDQFRTLQLHLKLKVLSASRATLSGSIKATFARDPDTNRPYFPPCNRTFSFSLARRT
jgi:hypothetical protein